MKKAFILFIAGALGYCAIEVLSRGYTHWSMGVTGGLCLIAIEGIYRALGKYPLVVRAGAASLAVTGAELIAGLLVNVWLGLNVWSYAAEPMNFMGQICVKFTVIWFVLCLAVMTGFEIAKEFMQRKKAAGQ